MEFLDSILITDGGTHFLKGTFRRILHKYGVTHRLASPYHPQTSGQVELLNREIKSILEKIVTRSRKDWAFKLNDALWAYRTAYKNPMGMTPYKMVYGKSCHLPIELEKKAYWAIKNLNYDYKTAGEKPMLGIHALDELRNEAYESARLFKEKVKRWHDKIIQKREFKSGDKVLLYNSRLKLFAGKLKSKWEGPYEVDEAYSSGAVKLKGKKGTPWIVNGQCLKHYRADEVNQVEEILLVSPEEELRKRYHPNPYLVWEFF